MAKVKTKCVSNGCPNEGTEKTMRGSEVWYYCKPCKNGWDNIMRALGV